MVKILGFVTNVGLKSCNDIYLILVEPPVTTIHTQFNPTVNTDNEWSYLSLIECGKSIYKLIYTVIIIMLNVITFVHSWLLQSNSQQHLSLSTWLAKLAPPTTIKVDDSNPLMIPEAWLCLPLGINGFCATLCQY